MALTKNEIRRKLLHLFALLMPIGIFYLPAWSFPSYAAPLILALLLTVCLTVEYLRSNNPDVQDAFVRYFGSMLRKEESTIITGATWVVGSALLCSILFIRHPRITFIAFTLFILGDAVAALVGLSIGKIKIGKKSLEGSLACFFLCLVLFYFVFPYVPGLLDAWGGEAPAVLIWTTSLVVTLFELIPLKITSDITINDNLAVPVIAGYVMLALEKMIF
jgi:dolichol kinase